MGRSLIVGFLERNTDKLQPLDYALLAALGVAALVAFVLVLRGLFRMLSGRKRRSAIMPVSGADAAFTGREVLKLVQTERELLKRHLDNLNEAFSSLRKTFKEKRGAGAVPEDLCARLVNYTLSLRGTFLQLIAATNALLAFERMKSLLAIYVNAGIERRFPDAPKVRDLEGKLEGVRKNIIEPLLQGNVLNVPNPHKFFSEFTVPGPEEPKVEAFNPEMDGLYQVLRSHVERFLNK